MRRKVWGEEKRKLFWWGNLTERGSLEDLEVERMIILNIILKSMNRGAWTGLDCATWCALLNTVTNMWVA
jgi:hypothetical protein